jgi:flagellar protein FliL
MKASPSDTATKEASAPSRRRRIIVMALVVLVMAGGGMGYMRMQSPAAAAEEPKEVKPGAVVVLDPIYVNLANGRYLKVGIALQEVLDETAGGGVHGDDKHGLDGAPALDALIDQLSGRSMESLVSAEARRTVKADLLKDLKYRYHDHVMDVYFTEFVMQ